MENLPESHKPVEIGALRLLVDPAPVAMVRVQPDTERPLTGPEGAENGQISFLAGLD